MMDSANHVITPGRIVRGRCALCRCRAKSDLHGFKVCDYHVTHGESDTPCPYCHQYRLFDPRWTYTTTGSQASKLVQVRQSHMPNTIFLEGNGECVLSVESVPEFAPNSWHARMRQSVVMVGVGLQMRTTFTMTQWASDSEAELFAAITPQLSLVHRIYEHGRRSSRALAGAVGVKVPWPSLDLTHKVINVEPIFAVQGIPPNPREDDITEKDARRFWTGVPFGSHVRRETVWRHNFLDVLDLAMRVFQIEFPEDRSR